MQILDTSMFGLRTVRSVFRRAGCNVEVTLFPMMHVGEPCFYDEVYDDALQHDVVLYEGIGPGAGILLSKAYTLIRPERLGLVVQPKLKKPESSSARLVWADLSGKEMIAEWRKIPSWQRIIAQIAAPLYGLVLRFKASRKSIAANRSMDDKMSGDEVLDMMPHFEALTRCIVDARDARLIERLHGEVEGQHEELKRVAVIYGAGHMRAVIRELSKLGFHCAESRWITIFKT